MSNLKALTSKSVSSKNKKKFIVAAVILLAAVGALCINYLKDSHEVTSSSAYIVKAQNEIILAPFNGEIYYIAPQDSKIEKNQLVLQMDTRQYEQELSLHNRALEKILHNERNAPKIYHLTYEHLFTPIDTELLQKDLDNLISKEQTAQKAVEESSVEEAKAKINYHQKTEIVGQDAKTTKEEKTVLYLDLQKQLDVQSKNLTELQEGFSNLSLERAQAEKTLAKRKDINKIITKLSATDHELFEKIATIQLLQLDINNKLAHATLLAPQDLIIKELFAQPLTTVKEGETILSVKHLNTDEIIVNATFDEKDAQKILPNMPCLVEIELDGQKHVLKTTVKKRLAPTDYGINFSIELEIDANQYLKQLNPSHPAKVKVLLPN